MKHFHRGFHLHLHSTYSDGSFTPRQLVVIAKALGYKALAVTDHSGPLSGCGGTWAYPTFNGAEEEDFYMMKERRLG